MQNNLSPEKNMVPEMVPEVTSGMAPEEAAEMTPELAVGVIPEEAPELAAGVTPEEAPEMAAGVTPDMAPEAISEMTPEEAAEITPELAPEIEPDIDPESETEPESELVPEKDSFMDLPENINKEDPDAEGTQSHFYTEEQAQSMMPSTEHDIVHEGRTYAGFFARFTAYLLDRIILLVPLGIFRLILWILTAGGKFAILNQQVFFRFTPAGMLTYALSAAYFILFTYITGRTVGKRIMRLKVVSAEDRKPSFLEILYRETFGRFLSTIILCIGYLMIIIGDEKEALHDYLSDTRVIYR